MRGIDRVEQRLLLVEIGAIERIPEPDDPARLAAARADLKLDWEHRLSSLGIGFDQPGFAGSIEPQQHHRGDQGQGQHHQAKAIAAASGAALPAC